MVGDRRKRKEGNIYWVERPKDVEVVNMLVDGSGRSAEIIILCKSCEIGQGMESKGRKMCCAKNLAKEFENFGQEKKRIGL